ncbi:MAG: 16S rRNA (uracil(1498)-N(3))-methyltransferase [Phycisphaerales bacterium]|nr:16S rRNA (uracil(1498)-N(3))-methyltransferase [Phycisphaerales bacterium]
MARQQHTRRFFISDLSGDEVSPAPGEMHHALHVLRLKDGQQVELFDGTGAVAIGIITHVDRRNVVMKVTERQTCTPHWPRITLAFAAPKGKRMDWLAEKTTELGVASLQRVIFDRSPPASKSASDMKSDKLMGHCISAAKQCGLNFLPQLPEPVGLAEIIGSNDSTLRILGDMSPEALSLPEVLSSNDSQAEITLLIGPEGGLTDRERSDATAGGFIPARLGGTILRTETASIAMLAATVAYTT